MYLSKKSNSNQNHLTRNRVAEIMAFFVLYFLHWNKTSANLQRVDSVLLALFQLCVLPMVLLQSHVKSLDGETSCSYYYTFMFYLN